QNREQKATLLRNWPDTGLSAKYARKRSSGRPRWGVSSRPIAVIQARASGDPFCPKPDGRFVPSRDLEGVKIRSFDHLVGAGEQRLRHGEAERLGGLQVYDQVEWAAGPAGPRASRP